MLCQFTVKNYKSIRDEVTFDMQAAAISEHEDRIIRDKDGVILFACFCNIWPQMAEENPMYWKRCIH